ncbi:U3 snoRNP protein, partial [Homalodisca vitripennis]
MSTNIILEDEVRRDGVIKSVCGKESRKKVRDHTKWKKNVKKRQRHVSKKLPTLKRCNHDEKKKSVFKCDTLNMQDVRKFHQAFYASCDKITQDAFLLKYISNETPTRPGPSHRKDKEVEDKEEQTKISYKLLARHYLCDLVSGPRITLTAAAYHKESHILVTGFSNGTFLLHELPEVNLIHSLSISEHSITSLALNNTGDWVAVGSSALGQLLLMLCCSISEHSITSLALNNTGDWVAVGSSALGQLLYIGAPDHMAGSEQHWGLGGRGVQCSGPVAGVISEHPITSLALNNTGDWVAVGSSALGQLLVCDSYIGSTRSHSLALNNTGDWVAVGSSALGQLLVCDSVGDYIIVFGHPITSLALNNTGDWVAVGSSALGQLLVW